jgi:hypothetical protein
MFHKSPDERLSEWSEFRKNLDTLDNPLTALAEFWSTAPLVIHNHKVDPHNPKNWPTPWDLIVENKYDDFTLALMIGYTLKLTKKYNNDKIEVRTMVDSTKTRLYNLVYVNDADVLNYERAEAIKAQYIDDSLYLENIVDIVFPR